MVAIADALAVCRIGSPTADWRAGKRAVGVRCLAATGQYLIATERLKKVSRDLYA